MRWGSADDAKFDLEVHVWESGRSRWQERFSYSRDLFDEETVERMVGHYERVLEEDGEESGGRRCGELALLREAERAAGAGGVEPDGAGVCGRSSACTSCLRSRRRGRRRRWRWCTKGKRMSYGELNRRANQLGQVSAGEGSRAGGAGGDLRGAVAWRWWWGCWGS